MMAPVLQVSAVLSSGRFCFTAGKAGRKHIDECKGKHPCPGKCINTAGGYQCDCDEPGYRPSSVPTVCEDVDECSADNGGCTDVCVNKRGSYKCRCEQRGRRLAKDMHSCEDIDECERYKNKVCRNGTCRNTDGSYQCTCHAGFVASSDDSLCRDIDECKEDNGGCQQLCKNTQGSFHCECYHGYVLDSDKVLCVDVDECAANDVMCEDKCVNTPGGYSCICTQVGSVLASDNTTCTTCTKQQYYDDSKQACSPCPAHAHVEAEGVATSLSACVCDAGFTGSPVAMEECADMDECKDGRLQCSHYCINIPGTAYCDCPVGYTVDSTGRNCDDIDECSEAGKQAVNGTCSQVCVNLQGSYRCDCQHEGYTLHEDRHTCVDVDECKEGTHNCSHDCSNTPGGFECLCPKGFYLEDSNSVCQDVNECFLDQSPCQQVCNNTEGSYQCGCFGAGFRLSWDHSTCVDINECMEGDNPCPDICINTVGSYMCDCNRDGYRLAEDSSGCLDINECDDPETHGCTQVCVNTPGSFRCDCHAGYRQVGLNNCQACPKGMYRPRHSPHCLRCPARSTTNDTAKGSLSDCHCHAGYKGQPGLNQPCMDVNECLVGNYGCQHRCVNTIGSAYCSCNSGYKLTLDRKTCEDVDECAYGKGRCHQLCINTAGSYRCNCTAPNFTLNRNGYACDDIDECETGMLQCEQRCVNTMGSAHCACPRGYQLSDDASTCQDSDECAKNNGGCDDACTNTLGSYECTCTKQGFRISQNKRQCVDINECLNKSLCEGRCENLYGSYRCHCTQPGQQLSSDGHSCEDVDECSIGNQTCDQVCVNTENGYRCDCFPGYHRKDDRCVECPLGTYRDDALPSNGACQKCPENMTTQQIGSKSPSACVCKNGYSVFPLRGRTCQDIDECNDNYGGCDGDCQNTVGSFACSCGPGYTLADDKATCTRSSCPTLEVPRHGQLLPVRCRMKQGVGHRAWLSPNTVCRYKCRRGYTLTGSKHRNCQHNGTWTGSSPTCTPKTCGGFQPPANGYVLPAVCRVGPVAFRRRCKIRCHKNFRLRGKSGVKCLANQKWSASASSTKCVPKTRKVAARKASNVRQQTSNEAAVDV